MTDQDKVLAKIRKLINMAKDTADGAEAERDTAMRHALKLMAKHNLTLDQVALENKEDREDLFVEQFPDPFRAMIGGAIAELFFCRFFRTKVDGKQKYNFHFVGLESNAMTAREMSEWVIRSVYQESMKQQKALGEVAGWGTTFRNGAALRIAQRCFDLRAEAEAANPEEYLKDVEALTDESGQTLSTGTALVLANVYETEGEANDDFIEKVLGITVKRKKLQVVNKSNSAMRQGKEFGNNINLTNQLTNDAPTALIK